MARRPGRLAQRESACFTRKRSLVQSQRRPPAGVAPSSSGPGRSPLKAEIAGSNPAGATIFFRGIRMFEPKRADAAILKRMVVTKRAESDPWARAFWRPWRAQRGLD